jgi:hypothetical protein
MNSEVFKDITERERAKGAIEKDKIEKADNQVFAEGHAIELMMQTDGWKIVSRDLELHQTGIMNKLRSEKGLSRSTMERYIDNINNIELFRLQPMKYINRMKMLIQRKVRGK